MNTTSVSINAAAIAASPFDRLFKIVWRVAIAGGALVFLTFVLLFVGEPVNKDGSTNYSEFNTSFWEVQNPVVTTLLAAPRYMLTFTKVENEITKESDEIATWGQCVGLVSFILLVFSLYFFSKGNTVVKVALFLYSLYWAFVTVFMIAQFFQGHGFVHFWTSHDL